MNRLILHIGPHKTGSTYLQLKLMNNKDKLESQGIYYPEQFFHVFGHHYLYTKMFNKNAQNEFKQLVDEINTIDGDVILSSENFSVQRPEFFERIKECFKYKEVLVVFYYRTPSDRLYSYWQEQIKHGSSESFFEYAMPRYSRPYLAKELNYLTILNSIADIFGKSSIKLIDYHKSLIENNSMQLFQKSSGIESEILDTKDLINSTLPVSVIEVIRLLNAKHKSFGGKPSLHLREKFISKSLELNESFLRLKDIIDESCYEFEMGNSLIDRWVFEQLEKEYTNNIIGTLSPPSNKNRKVPRSDWYVAKNCIEDIDNLFREVNEE